MVQRLRRKWALYGVTTKASEEALSRWWSIPKPVGHHVQIRPAQELLHLTVYMPNSQTTLDITNSISGGNQLDPQSTRPGQSGAASEPVRPIPSAPYPAPPEAYPQAPGQQPQSSSPIPQPSSPTQHAIIDLGDLTQMNPRHIWPDEAANFTPWLAQNIRYIEKAIGRTLDVLQTERKVGPYRLDIHARDTVNDVTVVIENQLEPTNHMHLGQLLTYGAGLDAKVAVWVVPEVVDEHRVAVDWLNRLAGEKTSFFLLRFRVITIAGSKPAVEFIREVAPSHFRDTIAKPPRTSSPSGSGGARTPSNKPTSIVWSDLLGQSMQIDSWRALLVTTIEHAIQSGIDPGTLPLKTTTDQTQSQSFNAGREFTFNNRPIWIDLLGSSGWVRGKCSIILTEMGKSIEVACDDGTVMTLPRAAASDTEPDNGEDILGEEAEDDAGADAGTTYEFPLL
jgi:hypothetical protein